MRACKLLKKNYYAGGWTPAKKQKVDATALPSKLGCNSCLKLLPSWKFSEGQQRDLREAIAGRSVDPYKLEEIAYLKCPACTPKQVTEMECCVCETVKSLDGFTKAQRRDPDNARCIDCVTNHLDEKPLDTTAARRYAQYGDADSEDGSEGESNAYGSEKDDESEGGAPVSSDARFTQDLNEHNLRQHDAYNTGPSSRNSFSMASATASLASNARSHAQSRGTLHGWQSLSRANGGSVNQVDQKPEFTAYDSTGRAHQRAPESCTTTDNDEVSEPETIRDEGDKRRPVSKFAKASELGPRNAVFRPANYTGFSLPKQEDSDDDTDPEAEEYLTI